MFTRKLLVTSALVLGATSSANAGPPWISIEYPSNPHHETTRNASFLIRAYHHSVGIKSPIEATAIGVVDGKRQTMKLDVRATNQQGVYALQTPLPRGGTWVLSMTIKDGTAPATALVTVDRRGLISKVDVPSSRSRDGWVVPRAATQKDVEAALAEGMLADSGTRRGALAGTAAVGLPVGLMLAIAALRRRRVEARA
jgi:hypothetical protein